MILGPVAGPTVGAITEFYDWRYVFYMNVPFGLVAFFSILAIFASCPYAGSKNGLARCNSTHCCSFVSSIGWIGESD